MSVSIDGGGVVPDQGLGDTARITFMLPGAEEAVTAWVDGDVLHIAGQYAPLAVGRVSANHVTVELRGVGRSRD